MEEQRAEGPALLQYRVLQNKSIKHIGHSVNGLVTSRYATEFMLKKP